MFVYWYHLYSWLWSLDFDRKVDMKLLSNIFIIKFIAHSNHFASIRIYNLKARFWIILMNVLQSHHSCASVRSWHEGISKWLWYYGYASMETNYRYYKCNKQTQFERLSWVPHRSYEKKTVNFMLQLTLSNLISKVDKCNFDRIRERFELERFELREVIY